MQPFKRLEGRIEAVNCVRGRRLFGRFPIRSEFFVLGQGGHRDSSQLHDPPQDMGGNGTHERICHGEDGK